MYKVFKPGGVFLGNAATYELAKTLVAPHPLGFIMQNGSVLYINKI